MAIDLLPLCTIEIELAEAVVVGEGPRGVRLIFDVVSAVVEGDRLRGHLHGAANADWFTLVGTVGTLDVRASFETDDGAVIFSEYCGRTDVGRGPGSAPIYVAPRFETGDPRYAWLNVVQAVGKGTLDGSHLTYEWYEVR